MRRKHYALRIRGSYFRGGLPIREKRKILHQAKISCYTECMHTQGHNAHIAPNDISGQHILDNFASSEWHPLALQFNSKRDPMLPTSTVQI